MKTSKTMFITTIMYIISSLLNLSGIILLTHLPTTDLLNFAIFKVIKFSKFLRDTYECIYEIFKILVCEVYNIYNIMMLMNISYL